MNNIALKNCLKINLKFNYQFIKQKNFAYYFGKFNFSTKKRIKPNSGSDIEFEKSKKSIRNMSSDNDNEINMKLNDKGNNNNNNNNNQNNNNQETNFNNSDHNNNSNNNTNDSNNNANNNKTNSNKHIIDSVQNHKCPLVEDSVGGRYAQTLFIVASQNKELYKVNEDMIYILDIYKNSEAFRTFSANSGLGSKQINDLFSSINECGNFCKTTNDFVSLLAKNKRFMYIKDISKMFIRSYSMLSKEEKIKIISATELSSKDKERVKESLLQNPENQGKTFIIDYEVNASILGGLQMYSENKFMDLSLNSRVDKLKEEVGKLI